MSGTGRRQDGGSREEGEKEKNDKELCDAEEFAKFLSHALSVSCVFSFFLTCISSTHTSR